MREDEYRTSKKICINCGECGHEYMSCINPISSFGIVNIRIVDGDEEKKNILEKYSNCNEKLENNLIVGDIVITSKKYPEIKCKINNDIIVMPDENLGGNENKISKLEGVKCDEIDDSIKFWYYKNRVKFLMVSRQFSLGLVELIRGKYDVSDTKIIISLFEQMTISEINIVYKNEYDDILYLFTNRHDEPKDIVLNRIYEGRYSMEYCEAKIKFNMLRNPQDYPENEIPWDLYFYVKNVKPRWTKSEWGFPKGRRENKSEENIICACREFEEETGYAHNEYIVLNKIDPIEEIFKGTDGVTYRHVYYPSLDNKISDDKNENYDKYEIGDIKWFTYDEAITNIRPYHTEKKILLTKLYLFIIDSLMHPTVPNNI